MKAMKPKGKQPFPQNKPFPKKGKKKYVGFKKGKMNKPGKAGSAPIDVNALAPGARTNTNV